MNNILLLLKKRFFKKNTLYVFSVLIIGVIAIGLLANIVIESQTNSYIYNDIQKIPHNKVGLLLGTSKYLSNGLLNQYFINRINATTDIFKAGKIDFIVISGDNSKKNYNEPLDMKNELIKMGIPENKIYLDYAGFRTYDSVIRLNKIFGQDSFTVISQEFHNRRAIYIAEYLGLRSVGFNAKDVYTYNGFKVKVKECFARIKVFMDLIIDKKPKFLGDKIEIK
jgi:SanA protein